MIRNRFRIRIQKRNQLKSRIRIRKKIIPDPQHCFSFTFFSNEHARIRIPQNDADSTVSRSTTQLVCFVCTGVRKDAPLLFLQPSGRCVGGLGGGRRPARYGSGRPGQCQACPTTSQAGGGGKKKFILRNFTLSRIYGFTCEGLSFFIKKVHNG